MRLVIAVVLLLVGSASAWAQFTYFYVGNTAVTPPTVAPTPPGVIVLYNGIDHITNSLGINL